jgi:protein-S-isoprenylcysteine O-methyltransferase Ste14
MLNKTELFIKYRSCVGIICLIVLLYLSVPSAKSITVGFFLILGGIFFRAWSSGYINKDNELAKDGPYALTKNPLYFGNFVLGSGLAVAGNSFSTYIIFFIYYLIFFPFLMVVEHRRLKKKFGREYDEWSRKSNSFFPKIKTVNSFNFNIALYMKNKEYRVLFFSFFVIAFLILKYLKIIKTG